MPRLLAKYVIAFLCFYFCAYNLIPCCQINRIQFLQFFYDLIFFLLWSKGGWWWTGRPGVLRSKESQRVRHNWETELNWTVSFNPSGINFFLIYLFIFGCPGSLSLHVGYLQLQSAGAALRYSARAPHCGGLLCCRAQALGTQVSVAAVLGLGCCSLWVLELLRSSSCDAWILSCLRHVESSQTRDQTPVPCIGRQILIHYTTKEVLELVLICDIRTESNMILFLPSGASLISSLEKCLFNSLVHFESNWFIVVVELWGFFTYFGC